MSKVITVQNARSHLHQESDGVNLLASVPGRHGLSGRLNAWRRDSYPPSLLNDKEDAARGHARGPTSLTGQPPRPPTPPSSWMSWSTRMRW